MTFDQLHISTLRQEINAKNNTISALESRIRTLQSELGHLRNGGSPHYQDLVLNNFQQRQIHDWKAAYEEQETLLADWITSQKAFKELAIQFGLEKGLTLKEITDTKKHIQMKVDVLENRNDPEHNTNSEGSKLVIRKKEVLMKKIKSQ